MYLHFQALSKVTSTGAMTYSFIQAIEKGHGSTYGSMLNAMRSTLHEATSGFNGGGLVTSLITTFINGGSSSKIRQVLFTTTTSIILGLQ